MSKDKSIKKTKEKLKSKLENLINPIYINFTLIKDMHDAAYALNPEYKIFWNKHPEKTKRELLKNQLDVEITECTYKINEVIFGIKNVGFLFGIKRLFAPEKLSAEEKIKLAVTSANFTRSLKNINNSLWLN